MTLLQSYALLLAHHWEDITLGNAEIFSLLCIIAITKELNLYM